MYPTDTFAFYDYIVGYDDLHCRSVKIISLLLLCIKDDKKTDNACAETDQTRLAIWWSARKTHFHAMLETFFLHSNEPSWQEIKTVSKKNR